jgi:hypothetical protein
MLLKRDKVAGRSVAFRGLIAVSDTPAFHQSKDFIRNTVLVFHCRCELSDRNKSARLPTSR